ncbi:futalosine hydrolase [Ilyomonas limi]|uniref:Futalosine hydrolase n=1 Tax=Ilyomonas limi TaxID=2575867 RepID=A0A4U3L8W2_9BACT|nr:futalosine hydrolase [Ilyomonas limi]TKK71520.1 futalosine hydrolase [Ilyomonas limi]
MQITIAAATRLELKEDMIKQSNGHDIRILYTGVGILPSAVSITQHVLQHKPDLIIQMGIAGCFDSNIGLANVVAVKKESLGDTGVQENGEWKDVFDMGFRQKGEMPFSDKYLVNETIEKYNVLQLPEVTGVTINEITTEKARIKMLQGKYNAQIESMEGAALHYVCQLFNIPFIQIRAISNYIGERDKTKWKLKEAVASLNETVLHMLNKIE